MKEKNYSRRSLFKFIYSSDLNALARRNNSIVEENLKVGTTNWQLTRVRYDSSSQRAPIIEGYCSKQSVEAGETLDIMVSTSPGESYRIDIYRTGYYNGTGGRLVKTIGPLVGKEQKTPEPGEMNIHECDWDVSASFEIPEDWISGVYIGKLQTLPKKIEEPYWESYIIFIVKDERPVDILFQCSDNTWQAYNRWPSNYSLYTHPKGVTGPWAAVSFDRPYGRQSQYMGVVNDPLSFGSGEFISFEFPFSYFLEKHGYDVSYCSNSDMLSPDRGLKSKAFISVGHDEYWDLRQYYSVEAMRDAGVSLLFFSGNTICWVSPFSDNNKGMPNRRIRRAGAYGGNLFHALDREKIGSFDQRGPDEGVLMGVRNIRPVNGGGDWIVRMPEHWIFDGTGMKYGDYIPGLVGWEFHDDAADIAGLEIVAGGIAWQGGANPTHWESVIYPGPKGNFVFNASTIFWAQGLSKPPGHTLPWSHFNRPHGPDDRVQKITHNILTKAVLR